MVKFNINSMRFMEACTIQEIVAAAAGVRMNNIAIAPRFIVGKDGEYIIATDPETGAVIGGEDAARAAFAKVSAARMQDVIDALTKAARIYTGLEDAKMIGTQATPQKASAPGVM